MAILSQKWKRVRWLIKNQTFLQMCKYLIRPKLVVDYQKVNRHNIIPIKPHEMVGKKDKRFSTLLIKATGIRELPLIMQELSKFNCKPYKVVKILDFRVYSLSVFNKVGHNEHQLWFHIIENYYKQSNEALLLYFDINIQRMSFIKNKIRKKIGIDFYRIKDGKSSWTTSITPIHSSDEKEIQYEQQIISNMIEKKQAQVIDNLHYQNLFHL